MIRPDGVWVCPICDGETGAVTCWHNRKPVEPLEGCSTWYGGRLLHLSREEVAWLKKMRGVDDGPMGDVHLAGLGFVELHGEWSTLTAEGENLCRHLWGIER